MQKKLLTAGILIFPFALFLYFWWSPVAVRDNAAQSSPTKLGSPTPAAAVVPARRDQPGQAALPACAPASTPAGNPPDLASETESVAMPVVAGNPYQPEFTNFAPEIVLEKVAHAIRDYASMFGDNPVGTNPEITATLNGNNPRQSKFINPEAGMRVNGNGELIDAWGTPYFFHQLSGTEMEIHSAGPDKKMWTADDLVTR